MIQAARIIVEQCFTVNGTKKKLRYNKIGAHHNQITVETQLRSQDYLFALCDNLSEKPFRPTNHLLPFINPTPVFSTNQQRHKKKAAYL